MHNTSFAPGILNHGWKLLTSVNARHFWLLANLVLQGYWLREECGLTAAKEHWKLQGWLRAGVTSKKMSNATDTKIPTAHIHTTTENKKQNQRFLERNDTHIRPLFFSIRLTHCELSGRIGRLTERLNAAVLTSVWLTFLEIWIPQTGFLHSWVQANLYETVF